MEVLAALSHQLYDVVLMDVQMPEMDGLTATRHICQNWSNQKASKNGTHRPQIIAMTANAMQGDREECLKAGMDNYISKAITQGDAAQLRLSSHTLKSSSITLGATTLANFCKELEAMSRLETTEPGLAKLPQIEAEYERVKAALQLESQQIENSKFI